MALSFERVLDIHPAALQLRLSRAELISANLANVDTPKFQAKDIDFAAEMQRITRQSDFFTSPDVRYRIPYQPATDGNTVALNVEQAAFAQNMLDYQVSLQLLQGKLNGVRQAIEGK